MRSDRQLKVVEMANFVGTRKWTILNYSQQLIPSGARNKWLLPYNQNQATWHSNLNYYGDASFSVLLSPYWINCQFWLNIWFALSPTFLYCIKYRIHLQLALDQGVFGCYFLRTSLEKKLRNLVARSLLLLPIDTSFPYCLTASLFFYSFAVFVMRLRIQL